MSRGILQHDMWGVKPPSNRWDWDSLRQSIAKHGVRNSLLLAPMPTASTSQVQQKFSMGTETCCAVGTMQSECTLYILITADWQSMRPFD